MAKIGFIGLGIMGKQMAGHLIKAGHSLQVCDLNPNAVKEVCSLGAGSCNCPREVAQKSDIIILMVPDTPDVEAVLFGKDGIAEGIKAGKTVIDMSSISPIATKNFAKKLNAMGVKVLDAPVSGGETGAINATLSIMVGGPVDLFEEMKPIFQLLGKNIVHIGDNGAGQTCKVANQIAVALTIEATAEALLFAAKAGADPAKVRAALLGGLAQSRIMDNYGQRMIDRNFKAGFRIRLHQKDLNLALDGARQLKLGLPGTAVVQEMFNVATATEGGSELDHSGLLTALEKMANFKVGDKA